MNYNIVMLTMFCLPLQQEHMISELQEFVTGLSISDQHTNQSTMQTVSYLKVCNKLFERGI